MKIFLTIFLAGSLFVGSQKAFAADFAAQMEDPKSPVGTNVFDLGFVALDLSGDPITVQCFVNSSATPFQTINLAAGGTSGACSVDASVVPTPGTYQFHIVAIDGADSATSQTVSVEYIGTGPGTPTKYDRAKTSNCDYLISFVTASDGGKTVKVELYRSTERSYTADASTKIDELAIGSNQAGSFATTKPVCGDDYYYAIRAFDALGNGSGVASDTRTVTVTTGGGTTTVTTTVGGGGGAIPVGGGAVAGAAAGGATGATGGTVEGAQTPPSEQGQNPSGQQGEVLGAEQSNPANQPNFFARHKRATALGILILLALAYYLYAKGKNKKGGLKPPIDNPKHPLDTPPTNPSF